MSLLAAGYPTFGRRHDGALISLKTLTTNAARPPPDWFVSRWPLFARPAGQSEGMAGESAPYHEEGSQGAATLVQMGTKKGFVAELTYRSFIAS
jgi:hypothetical protein